MKEISILSCKLGRIITMGYHNIAEDKNYKIENDEVPHPDLKEALTDLNTDLANALYVYDNDDVRHFVPNGFVVHENKGGFSLEIKGKCNTTEDCLVNVSSGRIMYEEGGEVINKELKAKLEHVRIELFKYMFEDKGSQQKIPFEENND